jgi:glucose uptake protein
MILPQTYVQGLILVILSALCWGSWACTFRLTPKWRFELYYLDFALGVMLAALLYAFTVGNLGFDGFSFIDDLAHAGKRQWLFAFGAGVIFNFANMLIMGAVSIAGMSVALPIGYGLAVAVGIGLPQLLARGANRGLLAGGILCAIAAIVAAAFSHSAALAQRYAAIPRDPQKRMPPRPSPVKAILLAVLGGLLMSLFFPLLNKAHASEIGMGPYSMAALVAVGIVLSTFVLDIFFINLPVEGNPLDVTDYFKGVVKTHVIGIIGGVIWCTGALAGFVATASASDTHIGRAGGNLMMAAVPLIAGLWGALVWGEIKKGNNSVRTPALIMLFFLAAAALMGVLAGVA